MRLRNRLLALCGMTVAFCLLFGCGGRGLAAEDAIRLDWQRLPDLPDELGVAGPFVGVHNGALLVAGGANFARPVWESDKRWHDAIHVLTRSGDDYAWTDGGTLARPMGYGAAVSTRDGVLCIGGNDAGETFRDVFLLAWDPQTARVTRTEYPPLPQPCAYGQAVLVGDVVYLAGGQSGLGLDSAMKNFWALDLSKRDQARDFVWQELDAWPGPSRAFNLTVSQHNGYHDCVYVMSGRRQEGDGVQFLTDVWEFTPRTGGWRQRAELPRPAVAGTGIGYGQSHILVLGGDDGRLFFETDRLRDQHPGFPRTALAYHTITDSWASAGETPENQVTTTAVMWDGRIVIASGELRPRVRSASLWSVQPVGRQHGFGAVNYGVLFSYLAAMVGIGVYFAFKNKTTDDYFRGGMHIPWWAAGCSIFATMLSSLTFTGLPSKAFAQDWVYAVGNFMIPVVAFVGVFVALPFYRRLNVTSAYEYLEQRFSRPVRLFGSASFTLFHIFRMAVVMSLTGLALAVATPLTPAQSVLLMGVLSIIYCTMGGIEAVIWTDTVQTVVLLGGALVALGMLVAGTEGGWSGALSTAFEADKFRIANFHWDVTSAQIALWVIVIGGIGQNISSYTADQAVVQRYMTTPDQRRAARSIWTNAVMTIPATLLFFGMGTALFAFYRTHPGRLDPTITTDQIFPLFIALEMPVGIAGLIVAGIFSAAQSTVSTSMNSTATTVVTDFMRPLHACRTEAGYLWSARGITFLMGVAGTCLGLIFVDPQIRSLFDAFLVIIGLFMGVLGGLFALGVLTRRANAFGALTGALVGAAVMISIWGFTEVNGYLYTATGITTCFVVGYLASLLRGGTSRDLTGLTLHDPPR
jgi:solute:Na+ symporter, SSS family